MLKTFNFFLTDETILFNKIGLFMKTNFTLRLLPLATVLFFCLMFTNSTFAQFPVNDNVCMATPVPLGAAAGVFMQVDTATLETGELAINPPLGNCETGWCDVTGLDGSVWFTFVCPPTGAVTISLCGSSYDSQLALYEVGTCSDFSTFTYLFGNDDTPDGTAGATCGPEDPNTPGYGLASEFHIECLVAGQTYYVAVDQWTTGGVITPGNILDLKITEDQPVSMGAAITMMETEDPLCPGGANGNATVIFDAVEPFTILWSTGSTTASTTGLAMGSYTVTINDGCGTTASGTAVINDGMVPAAPTTGAVTVLDAGCGADGYASIEILTGTPPFSFLWDNGSTERLPMLGTGSHTVSITDGCGTSTITETVTIGGGTSLTDGLTFTLDPGTNACSEALAGVVGNVAPTEDLSVTYSTDQTLNGGVTCGFNRDGVRYMADNGYIRTFDLQNDFGITDDYLLGEVEIGVNYSIAATLGSLAAQGAVQEIEARLYLISDLDLSVGLPAPTVVTQIRFPDLAFDADLLFRIPINYTVPAGQLIAVEIWQGDLTPPDGIEDEEFGQISFGMNDSPALNNSETWFVAEGCGLTTPTKMSDVGGGFLSNIVMNLVEYQFNDVTWTPADYLSDANAIAPEVQVTSADMAPATINYVVSVVDACGNAATASATVDASACSNFTSSNIDLVDASYTISPNPSNGLFNIQNEGLAREMTIEVYDLSGKRVLNNIVNFGQGDSQVLDLTNVPAGMYVAKLTNGGQAEVHKLVVE